MLKGSTPATRLRFLKAISGHIIAVKLILLLGTVIILALTGEVDLKDATVALFLGQVIGGITALLAAPMVFYYGVKPTLGKQPEEEEDAQQASTNTGGSEDSTLR